MKRTLLLQLLPLVLAGALTAGDVELVEVEPGIVTADLLSRRTAEYDYDAPEPGTYELPVFQPATDGVVLGVDGKPVSLSEVMRDRVVVLSFIYTRCTDPRACMRATGVLSELQRISRQHPGLAEKLLLVTLSFDPAYDTPGVMARYGKISLARGDGADWLFLTTRDHADLRPLLDAYGQRVDRRKTPSAHGPFQHPLRVYLIDPEQRVRNIYSYGLLDPRLVTTDALTLLMEQEGNESKR